MADNKVKFLRGTATEYEASTKDSDVFYYTTDTNKLYLGANEISGSNITVDNILSDTSENPVQNKVIKTELNKKANKDIYTDSGISLGRDPDTDFGLNSIAIGDYCTATGRNSIAIGNQVIATADYTIAIGNFTTASGRKSTAIGDSTIAEGVNSFAGGLESKTMGNNSFAFGSNVVTNKNNSAAFGTYNKSDENTLFSIGNGDSDTERSNAFEITKTGGKLHNKDIATTDMIPETVGNYFKPDGGIPKSDLAADVQTSLNKADTALQEHQSLAEYVKNDDERLTNARPANGGNADTVNGHNVNADVPADAVFTDTTYEPATSSTDGLMSAADKNRLESGTCNIANKLVSSSYTTLTISTSNWTTNSSGGYVCTKTLSSAMAYTNFNIDVVLSSDHSAAKLQLESWNYVMADGRIIPNTSHGSTTAFTFNAFTTKPTVELTIAIQGVS